MPPKRPLTLRDRLLAQRTRLETQRSPNASRKSTVDRAISKDVAPPNHQHKKRGRAKMPCKTEVEQRGREAAEGETGTSPRPPVAQDAKLQKSKKRRRVASSPKEKPRQAKRDLREVVEANKQMIVFANRKQLQEAKAVFGKLESAGKANSHSYGILINAHIRCGDNEGAVKLYADMRKQGIFAGVVTKTSIVKAYCNEGAVYEAWSLVTSMQSAKAVEERPNIRTINTVLRGCLVTGNVLICEEVLKYRRKWGIPLDSSTIEYSAAILSQGLKLKSLNKIIDEMSSVAVGIGVSANTRAISLLHKAHACAILGKFKIAQRMCPLIAAALEGDTKNDHPGKSTKGGSGTGSSTGGKRAWKRRDQETQSARVQSNVNFRAQQKEEIRAEFESLKRYIDKGRSEGCFPVLQHTLDAFSRLACFPSKVPTWLRGPNESDGGKKKTERYCALMSSFGGGPLAKRLATLSQKRSKRAKSNETVLRKADVLKDFRHKIRKSTDKEGKLLLPKLFSTLTKRRPKDEKDLPIKLEIGCGEGEWAVHQAIADKDRARWLALELRFDRVYKSLSRGIFARAENLVVLGGDASAILRSRIHADSISHIFINHPEPPQQRQTRGSLQTQAQHLITPAFLKQMWNVLKSNGDGKLTIVTDNLWYGRMLLKSLSTLTRGRRKKQLFQPLMPTSEKLAELEKQELAGPFTLWSGKPGPWCGHPVSASSQFDRIWKRDGNSSRYILWAATCSNKASK